MKIIKIYCNDPKIMPRAVIFNERINFVVSDSHSVGKSVLFHLIDYCLMKNKSDTFLSNEIFKENKDLAFFLEVKLNNEKYSTIKRYVNRDASNFIKIASSSDDYTDLEDIYYDFELNEKDAKEKLSHEFSLNLNDKSAVDFRKYIGFFLRDQDNQSDVFRLNKFTKAKDKEWKPIVASLLGIDKDLIENKYKYEETIKKSKQELARLEKEISIKNPKQIQDKIQLLQQEKDEQEKHFKEFDFYLKENNIDTELVKDIEVKIAEGNRRRNMLRQEIEYIKKSQIKEISLTLEEIQELFDEMKILFPDELKIQYENIIDFNQIITSDRKKIFKENHQKFSKEIEVIDTQLRSLNEQRKKALSILQSTDTMAKFKELEKDIINLSNQIHENNLILEKFKTIETHQDNIKLNEIKLNEIVQYISKKIENSNLKSIREIFLKYAKMVLNEEVLLSIGLNTIHNIEFNFAFYNETDKDKGHTFQKLLCLIFSFTLAEFYKEKSFFRTIGFDCPFDGDRVEYQNGLIKAIKTISELGIQVFITTINDEIKDKNTQKFVEEHKVLFLTKENPLLISF